MTRYTISLWEATRTGAVTTPDGLRAGDLAYCSISVKGHGKKRLPVYSCSGKPCPQHLFFLLDVEGSDQW